MTLNTRILLFIQTFIDTRGYSPTNREITDACGLGSTSVTAYHLNTLAARGWLTWQPDKSRTIVLCKPVAVRL